MTSFMKIVAKTPCSKNVSDVNNTDINNPWPIKCVTIIQDDRGDEREFLNRTLTREEYARFVCALSWNQIDLSNNDDRDHAFNCLKYIGEDFHYMFQTRMCFHSMKAYENNQHFFTQKQLHILRPLFTLDINNDGESDTDDINTDDEDERNAPSICPSCGDNAAGNEKSAGYECEICVRSTNAMWEVALLSD